MARPTDDTPERGDPSLTGGVFSLVGFGGRPPYPMVAAERHGRYQHWRRVSTVPGSNRPPQGTCYDGRHDDPSPSAIYGLGRLLSRSRGGSEEGWLLPNGGSAEKCGERQTGQFLVWSSEGQQPPGEKKIRECLPNAREVWPLGPRLFSVWDMAAAADDGGVPSGSVHRFLPGGSGGRPPTPRRSADRFHEASALTNVALLALDEGHVPRAVACLEEALTLTRSLGDKSRECDVLGNLGVAVFKAGQPDRAYNMSSKLWPSLVRQAIG